MATITVKKKQTKTSKPKATKATKAEKTFEDKISAALDMGKHGIECGTKQAMEQAEAILAKLEEDVKSKPRHSMLIALLVGIIIGRVVLK